MTDTIIIEGDGTIHGEPCVDIGKIAFTASFPQEFHGEWVRPNEALSASIKKNERLKERARRASVVADEILDLDKTSLCYLRQKLRKILEILK